MTGMGLRVLERRKIENVYALYEERFWFENCYRLHRWDRLRLVLEEYRWKSGRFTQRG